MEEQDIDDMKLTIHGIVVENALKHTSDFAEFLEVINEVKNAVDLDVLCEISFKMCRSLYPDEYTQLIEQMCQLHEATNKYSEGKIYKLITTCDDDVYVGSTCQSLNRRMQLHRCTATKRCNQKVYHHLNNVGWDNVTIELIEPYPCTSKAELEGREAHWINELKPTLNTNRPRTLHN